MTASSSSLAKVCNMMKSDMDIYLIQQNFTRIKKSFFNKDSGEDITYYAYNTYEVIKSLHKKEKADKKAVEKARKKAHKAPKKLEKGSAAQEGADCSQPVQYSREDEDEIPF